MLNVKVENQVVKTDMEVVISELQKTLLVMEANYQKAVSNLNLLKDKVEKDDLTSLLRRNSFLKRMHKLLMESYIDGKEVHVVMIDLDHFKRINDKYGHQTGDVVLERVSELIRAYLRPQDIAGRYGGEEIIVAMQTNYAEAVGIAEKIRQAVRENRMKSAGHSDQNFNVTLSVGIASSYRFGFDGRALIQKADEALYISKAAGRDCITVG